MSAEPSQPEIRVRNASKRFDALAALDSVSFEAKPGAIHALLGENGAGKSTLLSIMYGLIRADESAIEWGGVEQSSPTPEAAMRHGIGFVQQHFSLIPAMTALENFILADHGGWLLHARAMRERVRELQERYGFDISLDEIVGRMPVGRQQQVEIIKALLGGARVILFDEPTASLSPVETDRFLELLQMLKANGSAVVFVTHRLEEALQAADEFSVLRRGRVVMHATRNDVTLESLASAIIGERLPQERYDLPEPSDEAFVMHQASAKAIRPGRFSIDDASITVRRGEILGMAAVAGNGQEEWIDLILGATPCRKGRVALNDRDIHNADIEKRRRLGISFIPEDRLRDGLVGAFSLWQNLQLRAGRIRPARSWFYRTALKREADEAIERFQIAAASVDQYASGLSGGHQQRLVLARELETEPVLLVAQNPCRGLDVKASRFVHRQLIDACRNGAAVILFSPDLDELFLLCQRIAVMSKGRMVDIRPRDEWDTQTLGRALAGAAA